MNEEVKKVFQPGPMVSIRSPKNLSSYLVRAKIQWKGRQDLVNARVIGVRYVSMYLKRKHLRVQWPILHIKLTIALTVTMNIWYIFWDVRLVLSSMLVVQQMVSDIIGTIINVMTENMREVRLVCKKGIMGSCMTFHLHWPIKLMPKSYQTRTLLATYRQNVGTSWS